MFQVWKPNSDPRIQCGGFFFGLGVPKNSPGNSLERGGRFVGLRHSCLGWPLGVLSYSSFGWPLRLRQRADTPVPAALLLRQQDVPLHRLHHPRQRSPSGGFFDTGSPPARGGGSASRPGGSRPTAISFQPHGPLTTPSYMIPPNMAPRLFFLDTEPS